MRWSIFFYMANAMKREEAKRIRAYISAAKAYKIRKSLNLFTNIQGEFSDSIADEIDLENYV